MKDSEMPGPVSHQQTVARPVAESRAGGTAASVASAEHDRVLREVRRVLGTLRYGSVTLVVQDGRVVQVETTSKTRLTAGGNGRGG
jgi:hypothetical protein